MEAIMDLVLHSETTLPSFPIVLGAIGAICMALYLEVDRLNTCYVAKALWEELVVSQQEISDQRQEIEELRAILTARDQTISDQNKEIKELQATLTARDETTSDQREEIQMLETTLTTRDSTISSLEARIKHLDRQLATSALECLKFSSDARAIERQAHNYKEANASLTRLLTYAREQRVIVQNQMQREIEILMHEYDFVAIDHRVALDEQAEGFAQERREAAARLEAQNAEAEQQVGELTAKLETQKEEAEQLMKEAATKFEAEKAEAEQKIAELTAKCEKQERSNVKEWNDVQASKERIGDAWERVLTRNRQSMERQHQAMARERQDMAREQQAMATEFARLLAGRRDNCKAEKKGDGESSKREKGGES